MGEKKKMGKAGENVDTIFMAFLTSWKGGGCLIALILSV
jgi:hypothetical protein